MSETLAHSHPANHEIVTLTAASLSAAPDLTEAERTDRFQTVVRGTMEFHPTDPTQTMLASLILGHHLAIMDGFRDLACLTLTPTEAARARMVTVAQTKLVLQLARELRIARKDAQAHTAAEPTAPERPLTERDEQAQRPAPEPADAARYEASLAKLLSAYTQTLATLENTDTPTPNAAAKARDTLNQVLSTQPGAAPRKADPVEANSVAADPVEANSVAANSAEAHTVPGPATGSRAQRRATMKRRGLFKRTA